MPVECFSRNSKYLQNQSSFLYPKFQGQMKHLFIILLFTVDALNIYAQQEDTLKVSGNIIKSRVFKASYATVSAALISYGIIARENKSLNALDQSTHEEISEHLTVPIPVDDYSQFAPAVAAYGLNLAGIKGRNNYRDLSIVMATSYFIMETAVYAIKITTNIRRPDGSNSRSFPSGHTAAAFAGAHILYREYREVSPWICVAGYAVASGTGALRVLNRKHWMSDVAAGAGTGILSAEAGYMLLPAIRSILGTAGRNLSVIPIIGKNQYAIGLAYTF
jgi:hypothetical protein